MPLIPLLLIAGIVLLVLGINPLGWILLALGGFFTLLTFVFIGSVAALFRKSF